MEGCCSGGCKEVENPELVDDSQGYRSLEANSEGGCDSTWVDVPDMMMMITPILDLSGGLEVSIDHIWEHEHSWRASPDS